MGTLTSWLNTTSSATARRLTSCFVSRFSVCTQVFLIMYPSLSRKCLAIFDCVEAGVDDLGVEVRVLRDDPVLPEGQCYADLWNVHAAFAGFGIAAFCIGIPALALYLSARHHFFGVNGDLDERERVAARERVTLLLSSYDDRYWFMEALMLMHRFLFTGVIHVIMPETRVQLWVGSFLSALIFTMFMLTLPYRHAICDWAQAAAFLQLLITYLSSFLFFDDEGMYFVDDDSLGTVLVCINCGCFVVILAGAGISILRARTIVSARRLRYMDGKGAATPRPLTPALKYHCFLSHVWGTGQDQVRIMKQRLMDTLPGLQVFLDVDDLEEIGALEDYVDKSDVILVLATRGYFESRNCLRELQFAVKAKKQIICMIEPDRAKGGLTLPEIKEQLKAEVALKLDVELVPELNPERYRGAAVPPCSVVSWLVDAGERVKKGQELCILKWAPSGAPPFRKLRVLAPFELEVLSCERLARQTVHYGEALLRWCDRAGRDQYDALLGHDPIEWNRLGIFQNITIRLIAQRLLPPSPEDIRVAEERVSVEHIDIANGELPPSEGSAPAVTEEAHQRRSSTVHPICSAKTFTNDEAKQKKTTVPPNPRLGKKFHLFVSDYNEGAIELINEVRVSLGESSVIPSRRLHCTSRSFFNQGRSQNSTRDQSPASERREGLSGGDVSQRSMEDDRTASSPSRPGERAASEAEASQGKLTHENPRRVAFPISRQPSFRRDGFETSTVDRPGRLVGGSSRSSGDYVHRAYEYLSLSRRSARRSSSASGHRLNRSSITASLKDVFLRTNSLLKVTNDTKHFRDCEAMLVYLNKKTWTSGSASVDLGRQVSLALSQGIPLLLAHEMPGIVEDDDVISVEDHRRNRYGCDFALFFQTTPQYLIDAGIYHTVAVALKGGDYREASIALLSRKVSDISRALRHRSQDLRMIRNAVSDALGDDHDKTQESKHDELIESNASLDEHLKPLPTEYTQTDEGGMPSANALPPPAQTQQQPVEDFTSREIEISIEPAQIDNDSSKISIGSKPDAAMDDHVETLQSIPRREMAAVRSPIIQTV